MKNLWEIERLSPVARRRFLKWLSAAAAAPAISSSLRHAIGDHFGSAYAQTIDQAPTYLIEVNLRDQWDHGHLMVSPMLASYANLVQGATGQAAALFYTQDELRFHERNVVLTNDSIALAPHLESVAMIDCCPIGTGDVHGHEAACETRSPGRSKSASATKTSMFDRDFTSGSGNDKYYSSTPTPASLHNYVQKSLDSNLRNGVAFKGYGRPRHTCYHFGAGLAGAELDRAQRREALYALFPNQALGEPPTLDGPESLALSSILKRLDRKYFVDRGVPASRVNEHETQVDEMQRLISYTTARDFSLRLSAEDTAFWAPDVPVQQCTEADRDIRPCRTDEVKGEIWEQFAWATKLFEAGLTRTFSIEYDFRDLHGYRPEEALRTQAKQVALPLARAIERLKSIGIFDRTLIVFYTTDGSRLPAANSYGHQGSSPVVLAGGMIRGGRYGMASVERDIDGGHEYQLHPPDLVTGEPGASIGTQNQGRVPAARVWRTVAKALQIPDGVCEQFSDVAGQQALPFALRE